MAGVRQVVRFEKVPFDPRKEFELTLPRPFVVTEPDAERIEETWGIFVDTVNNLCKTRRSILSNKYLKRAAFQMGMEKICTDFSRRTENIKLEFHYRKTAGTKTRYTLTILKLSDISMEVRNARWFSCSAEIPEIEPEEAQAELVVGDGRATHCDDDPQVSAVTVEVLGEEFRYSSRRDDEFVHMLEPENYVDAPLASKVVAIVAEDVCHDDDSDNDGAISRSRRKKRTPLERMQELESIRRYLTEEEYAIKRQSIVNSI